MLPLGHLYLHCWKVILLFTTDFFFLLVKFDESVDQSFEGNWEFLNALWSDDVCQSSDTEDDLC